MIFDWFPIFDFVDFEATGLVTEKKTVLLEGKGFIEFLISKGNVISVLYDGEFMPIRFDSKDVYYSNGYAVYYDSELDSQVYLGFEVEG